MTKKNVCELLTQNSNKGNVPQQVKTLTVQDAGQKQEAFEMEKRALIFLQGRRAYIRDRQQEICEQYCRDNDLKILLYASQSGTTFTDESSELPDEIVEHIQDGDTLLYATHQTATTADDFGIQTTEQYNVKILTIRACDRTA